MILTLMTLAAAATGTRPLAAPERVVIERYVKGTLTDPYSARFTSRPVPAAATIYCGTVNSKSPAGGYSGVSTFAVRIDRDAAGRITGANSLTIGEGGDLLRNYSIQKACAAEGYSF
jgi:hypothetical protein